MSADLAVFDVETTGLFPGRHDRIVEIAVVRMTQAGDIVDEFVSLVNPERDIGPTSIHGLESADIEHAPTFRELAGELCERFDGTVALAGHNVRFDQNFLKAEFDRLGTPAPEFSTLCTMKLAGGGSLVSCCEDFGVSFEGQNHSALDDARATAGLLSYLLGGTSRESSFKSAGAKPHPSNLHSLAATHWPRILKGTRHPLTRQVARQRQHSNPYLQRLMELTSASSIDDSDGIAYSALIERVLEDRRIDESEGDLLINTALDWGLSRDSIVQVHKDFLRNLVVAALIDGIVTDAERRDLQIVAKLLGLDQSILNSQIEQASRRLGTAARTVAPSNGLQGKSVCFTGELRCRLNGAEMTREQAHLLASAADLKIATSVTKSLDLLVVADPNTQSGKAKKARDYGIRILAETVFWNSIGVAVH
ncbi:MAG: exonuclease domain-containing protein [Planctomycetota bacterium]